MEVGIVYLFEEIGEIVKIIYVYNLCLYIDGVCLVNVVVSLDCVLVDIIWWVGVDVLCFGVIKNGVMVVEAVIFFN